MTQLLVQNARVLTLRQNADFASEHYTDDLDILPSANVWIENGNIVEILETDKTIRQDERNMDATLDARGRVLMPAFVDCHTHACWAGDRLDEWQAKLQGKSYLDLLKKGGGIMSTVRMVRDSSQAELAEALVERLDSLLREGTATVEVKSGYGLTTDAELKMLRAIDEASRCWPGRVVATACIGHAIDPDLSHQAFVSKTIDETLVAVSNAFPGIAVDAYCECGAWTRDDCLRLFQRAAELGHPIRVHADQFHSLGMVPAAIEHGFLSVDHLEASGPDDLEQLAHSSVYGVMLPCSGFQIDGRYADGRRFLDADGKLAIATNYNPGSAPCRSLPMAIALAVRQLRISVNEAIIASTRTPARLLGFDDGGMIKVGCRADMILLHHTDERQLAYEFGGNPVAVVICEGQIIRSEI